VPRWKEPRANSAARAPATSQAPASTAATSCTAAGGGGGGSGATQRRAAALGGAASPARCGCGMKHSVAAHAPASHCGAKAAELFTYSSATAVRVALLAGGFFVGEGVSTGPRAATTVAMTRLDAIHHDKDTPRLLGADWLTRWRRSDAKFPVSLPVEAREEFERRIEQHPQFARLA